MQRQAGGAAGLSKDGFRPGRRVQPDMSNLAEKATADGSSCQEPKLGWGSEGSGDWGWDRRCLTQGLKGVSR